MDQGFCIRCAMDPEARTVPPAVDDTGYCGHCHWAVKAEVEEGTFKLREYLKKWAKFSEWERARQDTTI